MRLICLLLMLALVAVACGTTTDHASNELSAGGASEGDEFGVDSESELRPGDVGSDPTANDLPAPDGSGDGSPDANGAPSDSRPSGDGSAGRGPSPSAGTPVDTRVGRGITKDEILLGIVWLDLSGASTLVNSVFGSDYEASGTTKANAEVVIDHINANGGIAGRKIKPIWYEYRATDAIDPQTRKRAEQEQCALWTEDNQVFAMLPGVSMEGILLACAAKTGTPLLLAGHGEAAMDKSTLERVGDVYWRTNWLLAEHRETAFVESLLRQDFFGSDARVGIMMEDYPPTRAGVERALKPALARAGVDVVAEVAYPDVVQSPWSNYVLQMRAEGVTHLLWASAVGGGTSTILFMRAAEDQRYRPRHAIATDRQPQAVAELAPPEQLDGAAGVGWLPLFDVGPERIGPPISKKDDLCRNIQKKAGRDELGGHFYCELLTFLDESLDRAQAPTLDQFVNAAETFGVDGFASAYGWRTIIGPGRHDGVGAVRDLGYDAGCRCFRYVSDVIPLGK